MAKFLLVVLSCQERDSSTLLVLWYELNVGLKCHSVHQDIVFLASNSLHNLGSIKRIMPMLQHKEF